MTKDEAKGLASKYVESLRLSEPFAFYDDLIRQKPYGWIFFYNTKRFIETGNILYALGGNGPLVVIAATGEVVSLPTSGDIEEEILELERARGLDGGPQR